MTLLEPVVEAMGYELVEVEVVGGGKHRVLRLYIDQPDGIAVEDCERVSHQVSGVLDVEDPIPGAYTLEVSSPGLDRPLRTAAHFAAFTGEQAKVELRAPQDGRKRFKGRLVGIDGETVVMDVDGEQYRLPLNEIERARVVPAE